jgi:hypothetical protein
MSRAVKWKQTCSMSNDVGGLESEAWFRPCSCDLSAPRCILGQYQSWGRGSLLCTLGRTHPTETARASHSLDDAHWQPATELQIERVCAQLVLPEKFRAADSFLLFGWLVRLIASSRSTQSDHLMLLRKFGELRSGFGHPLSIINVIKLNASWPSIVLGQR